MSPELQQLTAAIKVLHAATKGDPEIWHRQSDSLIEDWFEQQGAIELAELLRNSERWYA